MAGQKELIKKTIEDFSHSSKRGNVFVGFDGFVDNILKPVLERKDNKISHYQPACRQAGIQFPMKFQMSNLNICIYWYH